MSPERWREIEQLFDQVADRPAAERAALLESADTEVRAEVEKLLASDGQGRTMLFDAVAQGESLLDGQPPPQRFGPYRVTGTIGKGGMGAVYSAVRDDQVFDKQVAIKVLHLGMETTATLERFRQERQILAGLEHPNIARLIDGGETSTGLPYIVLEYVEGEPITEYCARHKLSREERLRLFLKVCEAVEYAHHNLVVHRDLKPGNILVTADGSPKLLDFGIAKLLDSDVQRTMTIVQAMTPDYASPEQVRGQFITTASDVYSLGVVLYELLTGKRPYEIPTLTPFEIERVVCLAEPATPHVSEDLDNIILMALRKEPARRYPSVRDFAADIERSLSYRPVLARPDTIRYRTAKFVRRNRVSLAAVAAVLLVLTGGIVVSQHQARLAERRFAQVRELANVYLFDLDAQIRDIPGTTKARESLVRTALRYLDSLAAEAGGDADLQRELGIAYAKVAAVQGNPGAPNLGHTAEALTSYRKALDILQAAARSRPSSEITEDIGETLLNLGAVELVMGNSKGARDDLERGLSLVKQGADSKVGVRRLRLVVALTIKVVRSHINLGHPEQGIVPSQDAIRSARQLIQRQASSESYQLLGDSYAASSDARHYTGDLRGAIADTEEGVAALEQADRLDPGRSSVREALFWAYENKGNIAGNPTGSNLGDVKTALESYRKGQDLVEAAVAADPNNRSAQRRLAAACLNMADALTVADPTEAVRYYKRTIGIMDRMSRDDPGNLTNQRMRALGEFSLSDALLKARSARAAVPYITSAISTLERIAKADVNRIYYARDLATAIRISGEIHLALGEDRAALTAMQAAYERARQLAEAHPADNLCFGVLADTLRSLGHLYETSRAFRNPETARRFYGQEVEIWQKWPSRATTSAYDQGRLQASRAALERVGRGRKQEYENTRIQEF